MSSLACFFLQNLATSVDADLNEVLTSFTDSQSGLDAHDDVIRDVMTSFRDFCTVMWLLHVRDKMSLSLRKRMVVMKSMDCLDVSQKSKVIKDEIVEF